MTRHALFFAAALALMAIAGALLFLPPSAKEVPLAAPFERFPTELASWTASTPVPQGIMAVDPKVPKHLFRTYQNGIQTVWVSVGYYPSQPEGRRPPAQQLLFPQSGWSHLSQAPVRIPVGATRSLPATLLVMETPERRLSILYWYQVGGDTIASDHWYRALLIYNRLFHRRSDGALVRIASPIPDGVDPSSVVVKQTDFIKAFYPELLRSLPR